MNRVWVNISEDNDSDFGYLEREFTIVLPYYL
jgi:hypothetical protein